MSIAVTGEGIICAIGVDKASVLSSLRQQRTGIGTMRHLRSVHHELPVGEVPLSNAEMSQLLGLESDDLMSRTALMGMLAVRQALEDAGVTKMLSRGETPRMLLISGTTVAGMDITERFFHEIQERDDHLACLKTHNADSNTQQIADFFGCFADHITVSTACSSAANALILGARLLEAGEADVVVAGGTEALSVFHLNGFHSLMILDAAQCRPFDDSRAGLNLGEGAAFLVLESGENALRRGASPHAWINGWGVACDAFHQTASSEDGEGAYLAMMEALRMAGLDPQDIQYVNAHGTGTPNNDLSETAALRRVFGDAILGNGHTSGHPLVSSTKSFTGHTTSASGSIEAVICILALQHHFVPANLGWQFPMPAGIMPTMGADNIPLRHVLCNAFGFGGNDSSLVFSREPRTSGLPRIPRISGLSGISGISGFSGLSGLSGLSGISGLSARILSNVMITSEDELLGIREFVSPLEARRMGKLLKSSLLASLRALREAGIEKPDAIITATSLGCWENSEALLRQLDEEGEVMLKPTWFMQSTHNTISSLIAIRTHCHGYNVTYATEGPDPLRWALHDAEMLLKSGQCKTVLVGFHDESTPLYRSLMARLKKTADSPLSSVTSTAIVLCSE